MTLRGQRALITGGGTGIGAAITEAFAAAGMRLLISGRRRGPLEVMAAQLREGGAETHVHVADLASGAACTALASAAVATLGGVDILVNNAGVSAHGRKVEHFGEADWEAVMGANLKSAFLLTGALLPHMAARGSGSIVMLSSISGTRVFPGESLYGLTKHGMNALAEYVSVEYADQNIRCFAVCPALVRTAMGLGLEPQNPETLLEPGDVAEWVVFLLNRPASERLAGPVILANSRSPWSKV